MIQDAQDLAAATLANCSAFQSLVAAADALGAAGKIYHDALPVPETDQYTADELDQLRPLALVYTREDVTGFRYARVGTGISCWNAAGQICIKIERGIAGNETPSGADRKFRVIAGQLVEQLAAQCEVAGRLASTAIEVSGPFRVSQEDVEELGDHQWIELILTWGAGT